MPEAYIVDAVRTPVGRRGGGLSEVHPADLGAHVLHAIVERDGHRPARRRGRVLRLRGRHRPPGRATSPAPAGWRPGLPEEVPGTTIDRQCGSSQQAVHFAAQAVMSGTNDVIVAGGVQNMSADPDLRGDAGGSGATGSRTRSAARRGGWPATATRRCRSSAAPR